MSIVSNFDVISVSQLAVIVGELSDPFAEPRTVLAAHGYTCETWQRKHDELVTVLARDAELGRRFERAFLLAKAAGAEPPATQGIAAEAPRPELSAAERGPAPAALPPIVTPTYLRPPAGAPVTAPEDATLAPRSAQGPALPFGGAPSAAFRERLARERSERPDPDPSGTLPIVGHSTRDSTLPFDVPPALALLKLDNYVALVAELRADPESADAVMKRHGLTGARDRERVHGLWRTRLSSNPELRDRFERLVAEKLRKER